MSALSQDRNTRQREGGIKSLLMAEAAVIYGGALVCRNATGYAEPGSTATGLIGVGRANERVDNTDGGDGALSIRVEPGVFVFANSASTDAITIAEIGNPCYVVDDQTVAKTDGSGTRSIAGFVEDVDSLGVWVRFDETLASAYAALDARVTVLENA